MSVQLCGYMCSTCIYGSCVASHWLLGSLELKLQTVVSLADLCVLETERPMSSTGAAGNINL